jgi:uncharacterized protein YacL
VIKTKVIFLLLAVGFGYLVQRETGSAGWGIVSGAGVGIGFIAIEPLLRKVDAKSFLIILIGLVVGIGIAALSAVFIENRLLSIGMALGFSYWGIVLAYQKSDEIIRWFGQDKKEGRPTKKLLDTSVIIDGRIAGIIGSGFLEGELILPRFVLKELQSIADSSDPLRRRRGRRGLDILKKMQSNRELSIKIDDTHVPEAKEVDAKLICLGKRWGIPIITNDYNLNKVAEIEGVTVLNINELAGALRPVVLPGEVFALQIVKEGKEFGQGVGYLEDGTMVVVEEGSDYLGRKIKVEVNSVLQTPSGRMIFTKATK